MSLRRIPVDPIQTLHERLICHRRAFVHVLAFVFHGLRWTNPWLWDRDVYFDVARLRFGFDDLSRPGDIDMLVVPCIGEERLWADATAIEVKSYGLSHARRETSVGDTGRRQIEELAGMASPTWACCMSFLWRPARTRNSATCRSDDPRTFAEVTLRPPFAHPCLPQRGAARRGGVRSP